MKLPTHLAGTRPLGAVEGECVAQFEIGSMRNFVYLILDWSLRKAAVVDPQKDLSPLLATIQSHGFELEWILLTHTHHDHIAGVPELIHRFPSAKLAVHALDRHRLARELKTTAIQEGDRLPIGRLEAQALHTPGHSAGECCYFLETTSPPYLFTGDTVFIRDCGRTDFPDGSNEQMFASLQRIKRLPGETVLLPGHHYAPECATTLAQELETSPPFLCRSVTELSMLP